MRNKVPIFEWNPGTEAQLGNWDDLSNDESKNEGADIEELVSLSLERNLALITNDDARTSENSLEESSQGEDSNIEDIFWRR